MDAATSGAAAASPVPDKGYPESVESSPRSRGGGEYWDEPFSSSAAAAAAAAANSKLRLMCSYGGHIVPRPHDKSLCYLGGDTRIVVVERHSTLADLTAKLSRSLLGGHPFTLKYQLPSEDLDSLISVTTDEDLDNMIEEYDRILSSSPANPNSSGKPSRLRLFLFPVSSKPESSPSSIGSLLDDSKSETWFVDALNGAMDMLPRGGSSDSASVNCLLGLEEDPHRAAANAGAPLSEQHPDQMFRRPDSTGKLGRHGQDFHSIPDSPMLDTSSSFGSTSSAPSLANLPPIRVRADDRSADQRTAVEGLEEHFSQMNVKDGAVGLHRRPAPVNPVPLPTATATTPTISPNENPNSRVFSSDDDNSEHGGSRKHLQPPSQQQKTNVVDLPNSETIPRTVYYQDRTAPPAMSTGNPVSDQKLEIPVSESNYRMQMQVPEHGYVLPMQAAEQVQQQQYMQPNSHLVHHQHTGPVAPIQSYYQMHQPMHPQQQLQQTHQFNQQIPMYYLPVRQNPAYNLPVQPTLVDSVPIPSSTKPTIPHPNQAPPQRPVAQLKPEMAANVYRTGTAVGATAVPQPPPQLIHMTDQSQQFMGYHPQMNHHPSQSVSAVAPNYAYDYADPVHMQHMYYTTQAVSAPMHPQYQTVSSGAAISDAHPPLQQSDVKQGRAP